jgi:recombination associated protein RdgC
MWFRNLMVYRFEEPPEFDLEQLSEALEKDRFSHCGPQDQTAIGWTAPVGDGFEELVHTGSGMFLLTARREERLLPATVIREALNEKVLAIEQKEDRKVGRKQKMDLKDELIFTLTPRAFTRSTRMMGLIMPEQKLLVIDSSSRPRAEDWISLLRQSLGSLEVTPIETEQSLSGVFTGWLNGKTPLPPQISLGEECLLQSPDDSRSKVHCKGQDLNGDEMKSHLDAGKYATRLELIWNDSLSFVINEATEIKRLAFSDTTVEQAHIDGASDPASEFDAAFSLMSLELSSFLPALWEALGGLRSDR